MTSLWPLLQEEMRRLAPQLRGWTERLAAGADAEASAQWQRRLESFQAAAAVLGPTPLARLIAELRGAWSGERERATEAARIARAVDLLDELAQVDAAALQTRLAAIPERLAALDSARAATPAARGADTIDARLMALFANEVDDKSAAMDRLLLQLEQGPERIELVAPLMRAVHSMKGAARAVRNEAAVGLAHALEDGMSAAQKRGGPVAAGLIDLALRAVDQLRALGRDASDAAQRAAAEIAEALRTFQPGAEAAAAPSGVAPPPSSYIDAEDADPVLRVRASHVGRLIALAGTGMIESRRLKPFAERQQRVRRQVAETGRLLDDLHHRLGAPSAETPVGAELSAVRTQLAETRHEVSDWMEEFGEYMRASFDLTERIYHSAAQTRLRPLADIAAGYPRMVRDIARQLGKRAHAEIVGEQLAVDRDVLNRIDAPLNHLLRNALDHGIETPARRRALGKPEEGTIRIAAAYRAGMLAIEVADDGAGVDFEIVRRKLVESGRLPAADAAALEQDALRDFLFAPGFSTREEVSEISGRGIGLDVVRQMLRQLDGNIRVSTELGKGTTFNLLVPISRAVTRSLVVRVAGEAYAFPLLRIESVVRATRAELAMQEGMQYIPLLGRNVGLVPLAEHLGLGQTRLAGERIDVVVVAQSGRTVGFVIESVIGEYDLATRPLDARLGRVADLAAWAVLPDGAPVVMLDVDDLMRGALERARAELAAAEPEKEEEVRRQRILVIDDSISVRELERQLLTARGYEVEVAVDGMDGWSKLREWPCDLVVTDVDMPRMDGIELTRSIKQDPKFRTLPVVIVSYRDRPEDRARGLEVRADAYLTKSDFQEDGLLHVVHRLIGDAHD